MIFEISSLILISVVNNFHAYYLDLNIFNDFIFKPVSSVPQAGLKFAK